MSESGGVESNAKADSFTVPYLQASFCGERRLSWEAHVRPLKIFQAKFNPLKFIWTVKQATHEDHGIYKYVRNMSLCPMQSKIALTEFVNTNVGEDGLSICETQTSLSGLPCKFCRVVSGFS